MAGSEPDTARDDRDERGDRDEGNDARALARRSAEAMYADDGASRGLGIRVDGVEPGRATARMRVTPAMVNGHGVAHGGYVFLLADTAFAFACNTYGVTTLARGGEIVFVAPVREGDDLVATGEERVRYGRSGVYDVTVRRVLADGDADGVDADGEEIVAEFRGQSQSLSSASSGPDPDRHRPASAPAAVRPSADGAGSVPRQQGAALRDGQGRPASPDTP